MLAVVIVGAVLEKERCRLGLARVMATVEEGLVLLLSRPRSRVVAVESGVGRKSRNTAEAPEMAEMLAGMCPVRNRGTGAPRAGITWGFADRIWERLSIS